MRTLKWSIAVISNVWFQGGCRVVDSVLSYLPICFCQTNKEKGEKKGLLLVFSSSESLAVGKEGGDAASGAASLVLRPRFGLWGGGGYVFQPAGDQFFHWCRTELCMCVSVCLKFIYSSTQIIFHHISEVNSVLFTPLHLFQNYTVVTLQIMIYLKTHLIILGNTTHC